jgi:hypothetical protein
MLATLPSNSNRPFSGNTLLADARYFKGAMQEDSDHNLCNQKQKTKQVNVCALSENQQDTYS